MKNSLAVALAVLLCACGGSGGGGSVVSPAPVTNTLPLADAVAAPTALTGSSVALDGSASSDVDRDALSYVWSLTVRPSGSATTLSSASVAKPVFTPDVPGVYTFSLVVNDGKASSAAKSVSITVASAQTQATCTAYLASNPNPSGIRAVTGSGVAQRAALLAAGGKLVSISNRYYLVYFPSKYFTESNPAVVIELPGTGGYPEAGWNDWSSAMAERGHAYISLYWAGGTPSAVSDTEIYANIKQIVQEVGAACPLAGKPKWLMGFSVGSAYSFGVMIRDVADQKLFKGQLAISGAAIGPLTTGKDLMHPTVEDSRSNALAVSGTKAWMYCGDKDFDHVWSMCTEMPNGETFVNTHGGSATLYRDPEGTHSSLPASVAGRNQMFDYMAQ